MIQVYEVTNHEQTEVWAIVIKVGDKEYFIDADQEHWPNLRVGSYPRDYDESTASLKSFPHRLIYELPIKNGAWEGRHEGEGQ